MTWERKTYVLGDPSPQPCGSRHLATLPGAGGQLVLLCQRPAGHDGNHVALWLAGVIEWERLT
jgi:hypothetical protein